VEKPHSCNYRDCKLAEELLRKKMQKAPANHPPSPSRWLSEETIAAATAATAEADLTNKAGEGWSDRQRGANKPRRSKAYQFGHQVKVCPPW